MSFDANVALNQLTASNRGTAVLSTFLGAKNFVKSDDSVWFQFAAKSINKANSFKITLDPSDTYTITFRKVGNKADPEMKKLGLKMMIPYCQEIKTISGVYFDQLKELFESETGCYLSFS